MNAQTPMTPGTIGWIKSLTREMTGQDIARMTAPGGRGRRSVRLELEGGRTVIATHRETPSRAEQEAGLLKMLGIGGAPVPRVIGFRDGLLLQSDAGRNRLSGAMVMADASGRLALARAAMSALETCRAIVERRPDIVSALPGLGTRPGWTEGYVARAVFLSGDLRIGKPAIDAEAVASALEAEPERFTRWDARLGNGAVQPDGSIIWFDWDLFGRRAGVEDISGMISDNYWGLDLSQTKALLADYMDETGARLCLRMAVFIAISRLVQIRRSILSAGWMTAEDNLRLDLIGAVPTVVDDLCRRMAEICEEDTLLSPLTGWFGEIASATTDLEKRTE